MLASIILLVSVAFCAQLHFCAAKEFNKLMTGDYFVVRDSQQKRQCTELDVVEETNKKLTATLTYKKKAAGGQLERAVPIVKVLTFDNTTGFYNNDKGSPVLRVADIKKVNGTTQIFLESKDDTFDKYVCLTTNPYSQNQVDLINKNCPLGSDGKPFFPVKQDYDTCDSDDNDRKK